MTQLTHLRVIPFQTSLIFTAKQAIYQNKYFVNYSGKKKKLVIKRCACGTLFWARETYARMNMVLHCPICHLLHKKTQAPTYCIILTSNDHIALDVYHAVSGVSVKPNSLCEK